jgi:hypothetical protein
MGKINKIEIKNIHSGELTARIKKKDTKSFGKQIILKGKEGKNDR